MNLMRSSETRPPEFYIGSHSESYAPVRRTRTPSIQSGSAQQAGAHINRVIKAHSETTVVTMMHLAKPPPGGAAVDECTEYLDNIAALTDSLPLTMLCGTGVGESVITTAI